MERDIANYGLSILGRHGVNWRCCECGRENDWKDDRCSNQSCNRRRISFCNFQLSSDPDLGAWLPFAVAIVLDEMSGTPLFMCNPSFQQSSLYFQHKVHRQNIIKEFFISEFTFLSSMHLLRSLFLRPLKNSKQLDQFYVMSNDLTETEAVQRAQQRDFLRTVITSFQNNLTKIIECHTALLIRLLTALKKDDDHQNDHADFSEVKLSPALRSMTSYQRHADAHVPFLAQHYFEYIRVYDSQMRHILDESRRVNRLSVYLNKTKRKLEQLEQ
eukprot:gene4264-2285_t